MAKNKTYEEALETVNTLKEKLGEERTALREFKSENNIKRGKEPEDEKIAAKLEKLVAGIEKTREAIDIAKVEAKELKPRKNRVTKYDYPDDCTTDADKKKYRAKMRREAKKDAEPVKKDAEPVKKVPKKRKQEEED